MLLSKIWFCLLSFLPALVSSQLQFTNPDGNSLDLSQSYVLGSTTILTWKGGWNGVGTKQVFVDLFVTSFDGVSFVGLLAKNISLEQDGSFRWTVDVPHDQINFSNRFVLRFVQARTNPDFTSAAAVGMSPSRGFNLQQSSSSSSSARSSKTLSLPNPTATPSALISAAATIKNKPSTPVGVIVGGVVGGLALIALGIVGVMLFRVLKRRKNEEKDAGASAATSTYYPPGTGYADTAPKYEHALRHGASAQELQAGDIYEADT